MKLFQKTSVAVALTIIMIAAAIGIGQWRAASADPVEETAQSTGLDSSLSTAAYTKWIDDQADVLTDQQEEQIALFNANWVKRYDSLIAVATRTSIDGKIDDYAYDLGVQIELAAADGILVINTSTGDCYLAVGSDYPMTDSQVSSYMDQYLYEDAMAGKFGDGVVKLFTGVNEFYVDQYGLGYLSKGSSSYNSRTDTIISVIALVVILVVIASILDSLRYTSYRQRYYGVVNPPYVFRPILFWHGPGYGWYQRRWRRPPPPPPGGKNADALWQKHLGGLLSPTLDSDPKQMVTYSCPVRKTKIDVVIHGLGWFCISPGISEVSVRVNKDVNVTFRKAMI